MTDRKKLIIPFDDAEFTSLISIKNQNETRKIIQIVHPEFSCVCPVTGYPDFARCILRYVPDTSIVELKSWKLFLADHYGVGVLHEYAMQHIADTFNEVIQPRWSRIIMDWSSRGGLKTTTMLTWSGKYDGYSSRPDDWEVDAFTDAQYEWNNR